MPAWQKLASDEQIWKVATFLSHIDKLPLAVEREWKAPGPAAAPQPAH